MSPIALGLHALGVGPRGGTYLYFDGLNDLINCGSDASLDDLPSGAILTVDGWARLDASAAGYYMIANKAVADTDGWHLGVLGGGLDGRVRFLVALGTTIVQAISPAGISIRDGKWHHWGGYYNDSTKTGRVAIDGNWGTASIGAGAYKSDAAQTLYVGRDNSAGQWWPGGIGWLRLSNNDRYGAATGNPFSFPGRINPPAKDGNTIEMWYLNEGYGSVTKARVTSPTNDGAITGATWMRG